MATEKHDALSGASRLTDVLCRLRKELDFVAERAKQDIFLEDGTLVMAGASHLPMLAKLDKIISLTKNLSQAAPVQVDH